MSNIHKDIMENWEADDWTRSNQSEDDGRSRFTLLREGRPIVSDTLLNLHMRGMERYFKNKSK